MVNGIINIYKEKGYTSFDVVARLRGIFHQKKIGHTGTLDPDAEGVLPVCLGRATKVCDLLTDKDKVYETVLLLGRETDTQDVSGQTLAEASVTCSEQEVRRTILSFVGEQEQIPPMYSALKVNGQKLCDLARQGITVERKSRPVTIYSIEILEICLPEVRMRVHCSKGTYIRTLCHDIGRRLGCYGCMKSLLRTRVSVFSLEEALKISELSQILEENKNINPNEIEVDDKKMILSVDCLFPELPCVSAREEAYPLLANGNKLPLAMIGGLKEEYVSQQLRLYDAKGEFVGIYQTVPEAGELKPVKIFWEHL